MKDFKEKIDKINKRAREHFVTAQFGDTWKEYATSIDKQEIIDIAWYQGRRAILLERELEKMHYENASKHATVICMIFSLKTPEKKLLESIDLIYNSLVEHDVELVFGHIPSVTCKRMGIEPHRAILRLEELFSNRKNFYVEGVGTDRFAMMRYAVANDAILYILGEELDDVKEEVKIHRGYERVCTIHI